MTRRHLMALTLILALADAVTAAAVFLGVSVVRFESDPSAVWSVGISPGAASVLFATAWFAVCWLLGLYRLRVRWSLFAEARDVVRATITVAALSLSLLFLFHQDDVSRLFIALVLLVQPLAAILLRAVLRLRVDSQGRQGRNSTYMIIAGTGSGAEAFANEVEGHPGLGIRVVGHLTVPSAGPVASPANSASIGSLVSRPVLGAIDEMHAIFRRQVIDEVAVCLPPGSEEFLEPVVSIAADEGKTVRVPRTLEEGILRNAYSEEFAGFWVRSVVHDGQWEVGRVAKRLFDVAGSLVALLLLAPVWILAAVTIKVRDGSPVLFRQTRIGLHGRPFSMLKFRTMAVGAEDRLAELAALNEISGPAFKVTDDPRITKVGSFLRRFSLDELPQLLNVVAGDMSLVGPRPALPHEVDAYDIWHRRRLSVRPGMTGLWQIHARSDPDFDERATLDLRYIDQWSLWLDLGIIVRTVPAILTPRGR